MDGAVLLAGGIVAALFVAMMALERVNRRRGGDGSTSPLEMSPEDAAAEAFRPRSEAPAIPRSGEVDGPAYEIEYVNAIGEVSERVIRVVDVEGFSTYAFVRAYCFLRQDERTFRSDRIEAMRDHRTGEVIADPVAHFAKFYDPPDELSISHAAVMNRALPGLLVLIWIARADGEIDAGAKEMLLEFIAARLAAAGPKEGGLAWDREAASRHMDIARPTFDHAAGSLARMPVAGRIASVVRAYADRLAATSPARMRRAKRLKLLG